ncbi:flavin reductase family protein [Streptomyces sp. NBC_01244]|uniref:flavin reductase family protein n=1 Tax=Streptomyces sp. NBC_01244 TaxID=2903797 RepID=UPI002E0F9FF8|nr:flavin reductase family protein [Streptomyces sp. NBC_01244]
MRSSAKAPARLLIDQLAAPVAVLTVRHQGRTHGTTVSTLTRVSHRPLLVGTALRAGSVLSRLASAEGRFAVNVLGASQSSIARWFASSARPDGVEQFAAVDWHPDPYTAAPLLDGALAHYACRLSASYVVGDHEVLLGQVVRVDSGAGDPLLSYGGGLVAGALHPQTGPGGIPQPHIEEEAG